MTSFLSSLTCLRNQFVKLTLLLLISYEINYNSNRANGEVAPISQYNELKGTPRPKGSIWPRPRIHPTESKYFSINTAKFNIELLDSSTNSEIFCPLLEWAVHHYRKLIQNMDIHHTKHNQDTNDQYQIHKESSHPHPHRLIIELHRCADYPLDYHPHYERYTLDVRGQMKCNGSSKCNGTIAVLTAFSPQAAIRGLESFYQMLWIDGDISDDDDDGNNFNININATYIVDLPRFVHRGLMLDTSRHFLPEKVIINILTGMMYNKLNVFHWHIIDDQSFPFESRVFPELSQKGAYHRNAVYSPETVQRIIEAARVRGIRTILEFDTPGHSAAIGKSHLELLTPCYGDGVTPGTPHPSKFAAYENLDPTNEKVYDFTRELFTEIVTNVTRDKYIHLGMDEVYMGCWESSPLIEKFMNKNNYTEIHQVQEHYTKRHVEMVKSLGAKLIAWQDPLDDGVELDKDVVIQIWKDWGSKPFSSTLLKFLNKGYRVLLSACWYINYINYGESWRNYYECDPYLNGRVPQEQRGQVLGGEAALWGEYVDSTNIVPRIFPFVGAVGAVLWDTNIDTSIGKESTDDALFRLDTFRCSLLQRGIAAQPIYPGSCGAFETEVNFGFN